MFDVHPAKSGSDEFLGGVTSKILFVIPILWGND